MSYSKDVLYQIQQNEKKYRQQVIEVTENPLLKEYIQYLKNKNEELEKRIKELLESLISPYPSKKY